MKFSKAWRIPAPRKRHRTTFSHTQLNVLEEAFARQQYLIGSERLRLAALLNIGVTQVLFEALMNTKLY